MARTRQGEQVLVRIVPRIRKKKLYPVNRHQQFSRASLASLLRGLWFISRMSGRRGSSFRSGCNHNQTNVFFSFTSALDSLSVGNAYV